MLCSAVERRAPDAMDEKTAFDSIGCSPMSTAPVELRSRVELPTTESGPPVSRSDREATPPSTISRLRAILDATGDAIVFVDADGSLVDTNERFLRLFDLDPERARVLRFAELARLVEPLLADPEAAGHLLDPQSATDAEHPLVLRMRDGRVLEATSKEAVRDDEPIGLVWRFSDVTAKTRLEELRNRLAAVVEGSDDAIVSKTLQGIITTWNAGAERLFGYRAEEAVGKSILILIPEDHRSEEEEILRRLAAGERIEHYETLRIHRDGRRIPVSLTISPIRDASGDIVGASKIARDMTARVESERALAELYRRLQNASDERLELLGAERAARAEAEHTSLMKDEFLATLSHELRTPLNAIVGWTQILQSYHCDDPRTAEGLEVIDRNARVQTQLIEDLLDMNRIVSGKLRIDVHRVDLQEVVRAATESVRHSADAKGLHLTHVLDERAGPILGDPARLQQCCWNLLSNAIKFTPRGGKVHVSLRRVSSHVELAVVDTGQGISEEFLPYVFERFRQADASTTRVHRGLGLGLSIVKSLVELHGGTVGARSAGVGQGSTFRIELPLMAVDEKEAQQRRLGPRGEGPEQPSLRGLKIVMVDDEADARLLVKRLLEDCGAKVVLAESAREGLESVRREHPNMLISDIGMPEEDGYAFIRKVRSLRPEDGGDTPAAALSAFARAQDRTRALRAGYQTYIAKPVDPSELTAAVASLARK
jgi:PAS domain S-box-containing protein